MLFIENGNYPRFIGDLLLIDSAWSEGKNLPSGWNQVAEIDQPTLKENQYFVELPPEIVDGEYRQVWEVRSLTEEQIAYKELRAEALVNGLAQGKTYEEIMIELGEEI